MKVKILNECGYEEALFGLGLSYGLTEDSDIQVLEENQELADKLVGTSYKVVYKEGGHNKFLESIQVWLDVTAPRYWWSEADTYRVGSTKQSASTMHTLLKKPFTQDMFENSIPLEYLAYLEKMRIEKDFTSIKNLLPEGFLQRRIWNVNYKVLRNILSQRRFHRLVQWNYFCMEIYKNINHPSYFKDIMSA